MSILHRSIPDDAHHHRHGALGMQFWIHSTATSKLAHTRTNGMLRCHIDEAEVIALDHPANKLRRKKSEWFIKYPRDSIGNFSASSRAPSAVNESNLFYYYFGSATRASLFGMSISLASRERERDFYIPRGVAAVVMGQRDRPMYVQVLGIGHWPAPWLDGEGGIGPFAFSCSRWQSFEWNCCLKQIFRVTGFFCPLSSSDMIQFLFNNMAL